MTRSSESLALLAVLLLSLPVGAAGSPPGDVVDEFFDAYRAGSLEQMLASYSVEAVFEDVNQRHRFVGRDQVGQLLGSLVAMHHEMGVEEKRRVVSGNVVVVEYDYVGQLNGAALGQAVGKTGCPDLEYTLASTSWFVIEDNKIKQQRDFIDLATFQEIRQQLLAAAN